MIHPYLDRPAQLFLLETQYHTNNPGMQVLPPIISHNADGSYSPMVRCLLQPNDDEQTS